VIVDASALVAIVLTEPGYGELIDLIAGSTSTGMSAGNLLETMIVVDSRGTEQQRRRADAFRRDLGIHTEPVTATQVEIARSAYREYGRGSGHKAKLNFGDCFAYALAIDKDEPLLFVGDDFGHTDVRRAR
jgi:ribonuclease VapC